MSLSAGHQLGRYRIVARLGAGGMGEVYRATDLSLKRDVALKVISEHVARRADSVRRFTREAQAASALNHPNIITIFDIGADEARPFLVMELVSGRTLRTFIERHCEPALIPRLGVQIASALAAAHAAGIVHRDLKPENVMVTDEGRVKVLDFGLARMSPPRITRGSDVTQSGASTSTPKLTVSGTLAYMSPEQMRGDAVGPPSDVFSLGVVLYELAAGRLPFAGPCPHILDRITSPEPPPPPNASTPAPFAALISRMLDADPQRRPDANDVLRELEALIAASETSGRDTTPRPKHIVGHDALRRLLREAIGQTEAGHGHIVVLSGEPGIGKTTLAEDCVEELRHSRRPSVVGRGRCSERLAEGGAYLPWLEVLESMTEETGAPLSKSLKALAPTWYAQIAPDADGRSIDSSVLAPGGSAEGMKRELAGFLFRVSQYRPVVVLLDDLQWADPSTTELLAYLGPRLVSNRVLLIGTYRDADARSPGCPLLPIKLDLQTRGICRDLRVEFLTADDVARYVDLEFPDHRFPPSFAQTIHAKTEGNPLFMADLVRSLRQSGAIRFENGTAHLARPVSDVVSDVPESTRSMVELKIGRLEEGDRRLLAAASVLGSEFESAIVAGVLELPQVDVEDRLEVLDRVHVLVQRVRESSLRQKSVSVRYRFVHGLYQQALFASLVASRRVMLSGRAAAAMLSAYGQDADARASEVALLFEAAREFASAAAYFATASERAQGMFASADATLLARRGLDLLQTQPAAPERDTLELRLLTALVMALGSLAPTLPELEPVYARISALRDTSRRDADLVSLAFGKGSFHLLRAELREAAEVAEDLRRLGERDADEQILVWACWQFGAAYGHLGERLQEAHERLAEGIRLYRPAVSEATPHFTPFDAGIGCYSQDARLCWMLGYPDRAVTLAERAVSLAEESRSPFMVTMAAFFAGWLRQHRREPSRVVEITQPALAIADQYGFGMIRHWLRAITGWALVHLGDHTGAGWITEALDEVERLHTRLARPNFIALLADALAREGRTDEARLALEEARTTAERTEERCYLSEIHRQIAATYMDAPTSLDHHDRIEQELAAAIDLARRQGVRSFELRAVTTRARWWRRHGRTAEALTDLTEALGGLTEGFNTPDYRDALAERDALAHSV